MGWFIGQLGQSDIPHPAGMTTVESKPREGLRPPNTNTTSRPTQRYTEQYTGMLTRFGYDNLLVALLMGHTDALP